MVELSPEICLKIKAARRAAKLSQSVLAAEVGCKQSALSMFEQGDGTKLSAETISKLAERFGVSLAAGGEEENLPAIGRATLPSVSVVHGYCPNAHCPTNSLYEVDGRKLVLPNRQKADPVGGRFCAYCGEVLEKVCPNCGAAVHDGAICSHCGEPYIAVV